MKNALGKSAASSPETSAADSEGVVANRMAKILSTLSAQAQQHPKLSELLGLSVAELCNSDNAEPKAG